MKKVLAIASLLVILTTAAATMVSASEGNWRFYLKPDDGSGSYSAGSMSIGEAPTATDATIGDTADFRYPWGTTQSVLKAVGSVYGDAAWLKDIKKGGDGQLKTWDLRVAGLTGANTETPIRLQFLTVSGTVLPTATIGGKAVQYKLQMVDNKGMAGAPANGTIWDIPVPTAHSTAAYFSVTLPGLDLTAGNSDASLIADGYALKFYQTTDTVVTPEPGSLMALGTGLIGLVGIASRKRRS